jgi:hypothetical protein
VDPDEHALQPSAKRRAIMRVRRWAADISAMAPLGRVVQRLRVQALGVAHNPGALLGGGAEILQGGEGVEAEAGRLDRLTASAVLARIGRPGRLSARRPGCSRWTCVGDDVALVQREVAGIQQHPGQAVLMRWISTSKSASERP